jgi:hypothetical protein
VTICDAAMPWVPLVGSLVAGAVAGLLGVAFNGYLCRSRDRLVGKLAGLPVLVAPQGCVECSVRDGEPHRYAGCPGNVRQLERECSRWNERERSQWDA